MRTSEEGFTRRPRRMRSLTALMTVLALVAGCEAAPATSAPSAVGSPTPSTGVPTQAIPAQPTPRPSPSPSAPPTPAPSPGVAHWESVGEMPDLWEDPHAVVLGDGRVLVIKGGAHAITGLWDPTTDAWWPTEGLNKPRGGFLLLPLADGRAIVIGGRNDTDQSYSSAYVYDARTESWSKTGLLGTARTIPSGALLPDGRVLVAGGYYAVEPDFGQDMAPGIVLAAFDPRSSPGNRSSESRLADVDPPTSGRAMATAELFDPATGTWSDTGSLTYARAGAHAVTLADGRVLVVRSNSWDQGVESDAGASETAEIYDPATGRFSLVRPLPDIDTLGLEKLGVRVAPGYRHGDSCGGGTLVALEDGGALLIGHVDDWKHVAGPPDPFALTPPAPDGPRLDRRTPRLMTPRQGRGRRRRAYAIWRAPWWPDCPAAGFSSPAAPAPRAGTGIRPRPSCMTPRRTPGRRCHRCRRPVTTARLSS